MQYIQQIHAIYTTDTCNIYIQYIRIHADTRNTHIHADTTIHTCTRLQAIHTYTCIHAYTYIQEYTYHYIHIQVYIHIQAYSHNTFKTYQYLQGA